MKIAWRGKGPADASSRSPSIANKAGPKRWWDSVLVGLGMATLFVVIVLKLTDMLPKW